MKRIAGRFFIGGLIIVERRQSPWAQETIALRFLCFNEGNECEVYDDLLSRVSPEENPDITVLVEVVAEAEIHHTACGRTGSGRATGFRARK